MNNQRNKIDQKIFKGKVVDYSHDGRGVIKINKNVIFVPNLLIGEEASIKITKENKNFKIGQVQERITTSPERVVPKCQYYDLCGGCQLQHMSYKHQLEMKHLRVKNALQHISKLYLKIDPIIPSSYETKYRNKIQMSFSNNGKDLICGFYKQKTQDIIQIDECLIEHPEGNTIIQSLRKLLQSYNFKAYDPIHKKGWIKYAIVKKGVFTNQIMLIIVSNDKTFRKEKQIVNELLQRHKNINTIIHHNSDSNYHTLGGESRVIYGEGYIYDEIKNYKFRITPESFYQVNPYQAVKLYDEAIKVLNPKKGDLVLDAYCGVGTISLLISKKVHKVFGVDNIKEAIEDAKVNSKLNGSSNCEFICEKASIYLENSKIKFNSIIVDPPRDGLKSKFINALIINLPEKILYISCEPSSLARDLKQLKKYYIISKVLPVDMFSQTYHVETITLLIRK